MGEVIDSNFPIILNMSKAKILKSTLLWMDVPRLGTVFVAWKKK